MKRLIKKANETITCYHATSFNNFGKIMREGVLKPQESDGAGTMNASDKSRFEGYTFLATTIERAIWYANNSVHTGTSDIAFILEVEIPKKMLLPDDDENYKDNVSSWEQSAEKYKQVKVYGEINSSHFKKFYIYTEASGKRGLDALVYESEMDGNWYEKFIEQIKEIREEKLKETGDKDFGIDSFKRGFDSSLYDGLKAENLIQSNVEEVDQNGRKYSASSLISYILPNISIVKYEEVLFNYAHELYMSENIVGDIKSDGNIQIEPWNSKTSKFFMIPGEDVVNIEVTIEDLQNIYNKNPQLIENMKKSFESLTLNIDGENYNVNTLEKKLSNNINNVAKIKRLMKKRA